MVTTTKKEYLEKIRERYRRAGRKYKKRILDEFCEVCGHHRKHAIRLLNEDRRKRKKRPGRAAEYGTGECHVLKGIWLASNKPCSKRMKTMIPIWLPHYENEHGDLADLTELVQYALLVLSARSPIPLPYLLKILFLRCSNHNLTLLASVTSIMAQRIIMRR